jgi:hypothetical protein
MDKEYFGRSEDKSTTMLPDLNLVVASPAEEVIKEET